MRAQIKNGYVWLTQYEKEEVERLSRQLTFDVPGHEHMPLFKKGRWDGKRRFFDWRRKCFRRGLLGYVKRMADDSGWAIILAIEEDDSDLTVLSVPELQKPTDRKFNEQQWAIQMKALGAMLANRGGIAKMATNAGKTAVMAGVALAAVKAGKKVTVLENRVDLLSQVRAELEAWSGLKIGIWGREEKKISDVMVVMVQSAMSALDKAMGDGGSYPALEFQARMVGTDIWQLDECHHGVAATYERLVELAPRAWRFGFSGTVPPESTLDGIEVRAILGDVVAEVSNAELIALGVSARPIIKLVEITVPGLELKAKAYGREIRGLCMKNGTFSPATWAAKMRAFVMDRAVKENTEFRDIILALADRYKGEPLIVLSDWVELAKSLADYLGAEVLHGKVPTRDRERIINGFKVGRIKRIVATSVLDEGISIDQIKVLILANTGSSQRQFLQRIGRGLRKKLEDNTLTVVDFIRYGHKYLIGPSRERIALWKSEGFEVEFMEVNDG